MSVLAGIVALQREAPVSEDMLLAMLETMRPTIPSEEEIRNVPKCRAILGRLAYGPDAGNASTAARRSDELEVLCDGELYNDEMAGYEHSVDYLAATYRDRGAKDFAAGLNGSFAAVIADPRDGSVTWLTDQTASRALFTVIHDGRLYCASEVKGLLAVPEIAARLDRLGFLSLLACGFLVARRTLVQDVKQLDYATTCRIHEGRIRSSSYWQYSIEPERDRGRKTYIDELAGLARQAVNRRVCRGKCGIMLSGGVDSRGILCCLDELSQVPAITYTLRTRQDRHKLGDWAVAETLAKRLGMDLSVFQVDGRDFQKALRGSVYCSDGAAGFIFENVWQRIREETGLEYLLLGDECMGWSNGRIPPEEVLPTVGILRVRQLTKMLALLTSEGREELIDQAESETEAIRTSCTAETPCDCVDELYLQQRLIHFLNPKRRVISRHGLGVRNPWLDLDVLNFIRRVPTRYRIRKKLFRDTLTSMNPAMFKLPTAREGEMISYHQHLRERERENRGVSAMLFDDNPLLEENFDLLAIRELVDTVCLAPMPAIPKRPRFDVGALLPPGPRFQLAMLRRRLSNPPPRVTHDNALLRVLTVGETLRQLNQRFAG